MSLCTQEFGIVDNEDYDEDTRIMILTYRTRKEAEIVSRNVDLFICTFCSFIAFLHMFVCSWGQVCTAVGSPKFHQCTQAGFMNFIVNMIDSTLIINVSDDERIGPSHFFFFHFHAAFRIQVLVLSPCISTSTGL